MYSEYYGLRIKPFENTPDPRFLFPSKSHREVLASLRYGVDSSKGFILVSGDIGTGKTTIIRVLLKEIDPSYFVLNIINPKWSFNEIINHLAKKLRVNIKGKDNFETLELLQSRLEDIDKAGRRVVLIIDEAHLLSEDTLEDIRLLSNIENEQKKLIQIVLVGQKEIHKTLQRPSLRTLKQRIVINRSLYPLNKKETENYINHRLRIAGRQTRLFNKGAIALIWKKSNGVPRLINQICDNALLIGFALDALIVGSKVIKEVCSDMQSGHRLNINFSYLNVRSLKWAEVCFAIIVIVVMIVYGLKHFHSNDSEEPVRSSKVTQLQAEPAVLKESNIIETEIEEVVSSSDRNKKNTTMSSSPDLKESLADEQIVSNKFEAFLVKSRQNQMSEDQDKLEKKIEAGASKVNFTKQKRYSQRVVRSKDNLWKIAKEEYGDSNNTIVDLIHIANPGIKNVNRIFIGQKIFLPKITTEDLVFHDGDGTYKIHYASFYNLDSAKRFFAELDNNNIKYTILQTHQQENDVFRVYFGKFETYVEAQEELNNIKFKYLPFLN